MTVSVSAAVGQLFLSACFLKLYFVCVFREAMGVVLHKDSKWYQQWKDFKDNNVVFNSKDYLSSFSLCLCLWRFGVFCCIGNFYFALNHRMVNVLLSSCETQSAKKKKKHMKLIHLAHWILYAVGGEDVQQTC